MSSLSYEYVWWPASEAYLKDQRIADGVFAMLKTKTPHAIYGGIGLEKPYARCIIAWDNTEAHNDFIRSSDYPVLGGRLVPSFADPSNPGMGMFHAHYDSDPSALFDAPFTEFVIATVKTGVSVEEARVVVEGMAKSVAGEDGVVGVSVGRVEEAPERFVVLVGRQSHQAGSSQEYQALTKGTVEVEFEWATFAKKQ
ncbi:unnamed protein product [Peniophora sp. CBMAI 1063]|nr:unnamed protein product [Peniophora sp. CBMAI 1063]